MRFLFHQPTVELHVQNQHKPFDEFICAIQAYSLPLKVFFYFVVFHSPFLFGFCPSLALQKLFAHQFCVLLTQRKENQTGSLLITPFYHFADLMLSFFIFLLCDQTKSTHTFTHTNPHTLAFIFTHNDQQQQPKCKHSNKNRILPLLTSQTKTDLLIRRRQLDEHSPHFVITTVGN